jgi:hypothetical protein
MLFSLHGIIRTDPATAARRVAEVAAKVPPNQPEPAFIPLSAVHRSAVRRSTVSRGGG